MKNSLNTDTFGNFNLTDKLLTKVANNQFTTHRYSKEWKIAISLSLLFDITAVILSIYAGYFYLSTLLIPMLESVYFAQMATISILILLELLVHFLLAKFFKFALKSHIQTASLVLIFLGFVYMQSFYMSTNGLSINESNKVSKVVFINDNLTIESENLELETKENISYYKEAISTIKTNPQGWVNGRRAVLTSQQLKDIKAYNGTIQELKQQLRTDVQTLTKQAKTDKANNLKEVTSTANKYYAFISIIMLIELIASGFLMFSWSKIQSENDPEKHAQSRIIDISLQVDKGITDLYNSRFSAMQNSLSIAMQAHYNNSIPLEFNQPTDGKQADILEAEILNKSKAGFKMQTADAQTGTATNKQKVCLHCENSFTYKIHNQKYCTENCRISAYEKRKGKKLIFKAKK